MGLIFDIGDIDRLAWSGALSVPVVASPALSAAVGQDVLLCGADETGQRLVVAAGRLDWVGQSDARITELRWFVHKPPMPHLSTESTPYEMPDEVQADLMQAGFHVPLSAEEADVEYADANRTELESYRALYLAVLRDYGFACALTGQRFERSTGLHPVLELTAIVPLEGGGPLHVSNFLPLTPDAALAFRNLQLTVTSEFTVIVDHGAISPDTLDALHPSGKLQLPYAPAARPDPTLLAVHRSAFMQRLDATGHDI